MIETKNSPNKNFNINELSKKNSNDIEIEAKIHHRENSSQLNISNNQSAIIKVRPNTSGQRNPQNKEQLSNQFQSQKKNDLYLSNQNRGLMPLAVNAAKKIQQNQQQQQIEAIQISIQGQGAGASQQSSDGTQRYQQTFSPLKNSNQKPMTSQNQQILISSQDMSQKTQTQFQHLIQSYQQQPSPNQYDKMLKLNNQYQLAHQVGINGLLNMTKQRGLIQNQQQNILNQRIIQQQQSTIARSQSNQKNNSVASVPQNHLYQNTQYSFNPNQSLQANGKLIATKVQPHNINSGNPNNSGLLIQPNSQQASIIAINSIQQQQLNVIPLTVFEQQNPNRREEQFVQPQRLYNKNFPQQINYAIHNQQAFLQSQALIQGGYSVVPVANRQVRTNNIVQKGQRALIGNNGYYYYDQPVAINGKQIGVQQTMTFSHAISNKQQQNLIKIDPKTIMAFKKGGSAGILSQNHPYILDPSSQRLILSIDTNGLSHEESLKQAILQELLEKQALPTQLLSSQQIFQLDQNNFQHQAYIQSVQDSLAQQNQAAVKKSKIPFANAYVEDCYKFVVVAGNNSGLIRKALERRDWWIEIPPVHSLYNFKWQPVSYGIKFERLSPLKPKPGEIGNLGNQYGTFQQSSIDNPYQSQSQSSDGGSLITRQMVNHFEFHQLISEKANLFHQLKQQCEVSKENIFDICPLTFYVEVSDLEKTQQYNQSLQQFFNVYQLFEENKNRMAAIENQIQEYKQSLIAAKESDDNNEDENEESTTGASGDQNTANQASVTKEKEFFARLNNKNIQNLMNSGKVTKFKAFNFDKRTTTKYICPLSHFNGYNLWLLKPTHLNRGRGIHVFRDLDDLHKLIKEYCQGKDEEVKVTKKTSLQQNQDSPNAKAQDKAQNEESNDQLDVGQEDEGAQQDDNLQQTQVLKRKQSPKKNNNNAYKIKHNTFIIQKYIEKPLLLYGRKFDIRVWVLLNQDYDIFFFKEGYLRTSSSEFKINLKNIDDQYVHLTNNAVQKFSEHYGQFEDGNQLGYKRFQEIIDEQYPVPGTNKCAVSVREDLVPQMKELIIKSMYSVRKKIDPFRRKHCFELFGYDFILDQDFNMWLIEINTNPCIEESSELLKIYLPRMIEDMLRLTIDQIYPKIKKNKPKKNTGPSSPSKNLKQKQHVVQSQPSQLSQQVQVLERIEEETAENNKTLNTDVNQTNENRNQEDAQYNSQKSSDAAKKNNRIHPVAGYSNTENMWEKIWNLEKAEQPQNKYPNCRSEFILSVNDKQFKVKKNPLYKKVAQELAQQTQNNSPIDKKQQS